MRLVFKLIVFELLLDLAIIGGAIPIGFPKEKVNVSQVSQDEVVEPDCPLYNTDLDGNDINDGIQNVESWSDCGKRTYKCYFQTTVCKFLPVFGYR